MPSYCGCRPYSQHRPLRRWVSPATTLLRVAAGLPPRLVASIPRDTRLPLHHPRRDTFRYPAGSSSPAQLAHEVAPAGAAPPLRSPGAALVGDGPAGLLAALPWPPGAASSRLSYCGCHPYPHHRPLRRWVGPGATLLRVAPCPPPRLVASTIMRVLRRSLSVRGWRSSDYRTPLTRARADPAGDGREWRLHWSLLAGRESEHHRIPYKARVTHAQTRSTPTVAGKIELQSLFLNGCAHIDLSGASANEANPCATMDCGLQIGANYPGNLQIALSRPFTHLGISDSMPIVTQSMPMIYYRFTFALVSGLHTHSSTLVIRPRLISRDTLGRTAPQDRRHIPP